MRAVDVGLGDFAEVRLLAWPLEARGDAGVRSMELSAVRRRGARRACGSVTSEMAFHIGMVWRVFRCARRST